MAPPATPSSAPSAHDPVVAAASEVIGGPLGRYAGLRTGPWHGGGPRRFVQVLPWPLITACLVFASSVMIGLGVVQKGYCFSRGWGGADVFWHACFSDLPHLYVSSPLVSAAVPYGGADAITQPLGTGLAMWLVAVFVPAGPAASQLFVAGWAVLCAMLAAALVVVTARSTPRHPWRAAQVALCPLLITSALVAPDLFGVVLVSIGMWLWGRRRPMLAGVVLGAATASRTYALVVLVAVGLVALRAGVVRAWARMAGVALLTWLALLGVAGLILGPSVLTPYAAWLDAAAEYGSLWFVPTLADLVIPAPAMTGLAVMGWVVTVLVGALVALVPARRPAVAEVALVMVVTALVLSKSVPVQASLWLIPLVALAGLPWRDYLVWVGAELLYFVAIWLYLGGLSEPRRALPEPWFALFLLLRLAAMVWLAWSAFRQASRRPPARVEDPDAAAVDDPDDLAGPAAGAPDSLVVSLR